MKTTASGNRTLLRLLRESLLPIYLLNTRSEIIFCNQALAAWVGESVDALIGASCRDDRRLTQLVPPHVNHESTSWPSWSAVIPIESGAKSRPGSLAFLTDSDGEWEATLVVLGETDGKPATNAIGADPSIETLRRKLAEWRWSYQSTLPPDAAVGETAVAARIRMQIRAAASGASPVVVSGPKGTRRRQIVEAIHAEATAENPTPLQAARCRLLDAELLQATIRAAISTTDTSAHRGALLLLDVVELPEDAQNELIGFLQLPGFDLRVYSTARTSLTHAAARGEFNDELAQRLSILTIETPPLIERVEDLSWLVQHHIENFNTVYDRHISHIEEEALDLLTQCKWAGNYQELADVMSQACANAVQGVITNDELPGYITHAAAAETFAKPPKEDVALDTLLAEVERDTIQRALTAAKGNRAQAARSLQISRARLLRRIEQLKIE